MQYVMKHIRTVGFKVQQGTNSNTVRYLTTQILGESASSLACPSSASPRGAAVVVLGGRQREAWQEEALLAQADNAHGVHAIPALYLTQPHKTTSVSHRDSSIQGLLLTQR